MYVEYYCQDVKIGLILATAKPGVINIKERWI